MASQQDANQFAEELGRQLASEPKPKSKRQPKQQQQPKGVLEDLYGESFEGL